MTAFASYKISKYTLMNMEGNPLPDKYNENEIFVGGELSKREGNMLHYHAIGEVGLAGKAIGQFNVKGDIDLNFPLWKDTVSLIARGEVSNKLAPFYMRHYHSKHFMWDDDMDKEFRTRIEGELSIARWRTRLKAGVENIKNYTYFNQEAKPEQNSGSIQVLSASLNQDFKLGIFHLDNEVTWQNPVTRLCFLCLIFRYIITSICSSNWRRKYLVCNWEPTCVISANTMHLPICRPFRISICNRQTIRYR